MPFRTLDALPLDLVAEADAAVSMKGFVARAQAGVR
jgi:hypothetical protein